MSNRSQLWWGLRQRIDMRYQLAYLPDPTCARMFDDIAPQQSEIDVCGFDHIVEATECSPVRWTSPQVVSGSDWCGDAPAIDDHDITGREIGTHDSNASTAATLPRGMAADLDLGICLVPGNPVQERGGQPRHHC